MKNHKEQAEEIKVAIQTPGIKMNSYLERKIEMMTRKIKLVHPKTEWVDIYLKDENDQRNSMKNVTVRMGIPGPDLVATESGNRWKLIIKNIEKKLIRQLEKRKAITSTKGNPIEKLF